MFRVLAMYNFDLNMALRSVPRRFVSHDFVVAQKRKEKKKKNYREKLFGR